MTSLLLLGYHYASNVQNIGGSITSTSEVFHLNIHAASGDKLLLVYDAPDIGKYWVADVRVTYNFERPVLLSRILPRVPVTVARIETSGVPSRNLREVGWNGWIPVASDLDTDGIIESLRKHDIGIHKSMEVLPTQCIKLLEGRTLSMKVVYWPLVALWTSGSACVVLLCCAIYLLGSIVILSTRITRISDDRCWRCGYSLKALSDIATCPECGTAAACNS